MRRMLATTMFIVVSALFWFSCSQEEIIHDVTEPEANRIVALLQQQGIEASKLPDNVEQNTWKVCVPHQDSSRAWVLLQEYKLPQKPERRFRDVFGGSKWIVTPMEERALFIEALQGEIAHTLESLDGVIDARVHLVLPERDLTGEPQGEAKASVVVEYQLQVRGSLPVTRAEVQQIVAHAVEGIKTDAVAVVMKPVSMTAPLSSENGALNLVSVGPLVLERRSLITFKAMVLMAIVVYGVLGLLLFWQGRIITRLRMELTAANRPLGSAHQNRRITRKASSNP